MAAKQLRDYYYEEMKSHSQFENLVHFNKYTGKLRYYFKDKLNDTDFTLIDYLAKHAVKAATGVACPKVTTIATAINRSGDTVGRIVRKLERLGIIKRLYNMRIKKGGNGANFYIFQKDAVPTLEDVHAGAFMQGRKNKENTYDSKVKHKKNKCKTNTNLKLNNNIKIDKDEFLYQELLDYKHIKIRLVNIYGAKRANKLWQRIIWAFRNSELYKESGFNHLQELLNGNEELEHKIAHIIATCTKKYKENLIKNTFEGYLYKAILELFNDITVKIIKERTNNNTNTNPNTFFSWVHHYMKSQKKEDPQYIVEFYGDDWPTEVFGKR